MTKAGENTLGRLSEVLFEELERRGWWMDAKRAATHVREVA